MDTKKGIWLPIDILHDKQTTMQEKLLLMEINQLTMLDKGCIASNTHFAELFKIKKESVSRCINSLEKKGYLVSKIVKGTRNNLRIITINKLLSEHKQNVIDPLTNCLESKETKAINKTMNKDILCEFDKLWILYKRKGNKKEALNTYTSKSFKFNYEYVELAINNYFNSLNDIKYQMHFKKFLQNVEQYYENDVASVVYSKTSTQTKNDAWDQFLNNDDDENMIEGVIL